MKYHYSSKFCFYEQKIMYFPVITEKIPNCQPPGWFSQYLYNTNTNRSYYCQWLLIWLQVFWIFLNLHHIPFHSLMTKQRRAHSRVTVPTKRREQICKGGIESANVHEIIKTGMSQFESSYMETFPHQYCTLQLKDTRKQLQQFWSVIPCI